MKAINRIIGKIKTVEIASENGAMTVEAAIVLPVLLCAFFSIIFLVKAVYAYELMQHALEETASEIASSGYIYHVSGLQDIHDAAREGIDERAELFKGQIGSVFDSFNALKDAEGGSPGDSTGIADSADLLQKAEENFGKMLDETESAFSDPLEEIKNIACYIAGGSFNDAKTQLFTPVVKLYMKKYLVAGSESDADERLISLNIAGGFDGLDFSGSSFLADGGENIDIIVKYNIRLPLPIQLIPEFQLVQRAKARAWLGGDEPGDTYGGEADSIWSLSNFQRGLKIRSLFGANLPSNFPTIAKFENGRAVMIKSMDLTAVSYQSGDSAYKTLKSYVDELAAYKGQEKPWGSGGTVIRRDEIKEKELLLVIPENQLSEANERLLADMAKAAPAHGITLTVERYGTKHTDEDVSE